MERENNEILKKDAITRVEKYFVGEGFKSDKISISKWMNFNDAESLKSQHNVLSICVICNGTAKMEIEDNSYTVRPNSLIVLRPNSPLKSFKASKMCSGYLIHFTYEYLKLLGMDAADMISTRRMLDLSPVIELDSQMSVILHGNIIQLLNAAQIEPSTYREKIVNSIAMAIYYSLWQIASLQEKNATESDRKVPRAEMILKRFVNLVTERCVENRSVEYYANELGITSKYLSLVSKRLTGRNALKIIDEAVVYKAKELLAQQGLSINDVALRLNFVSQSFFGKYFKQRVGISPSRYRGMHV